MLRKIRAAGDDSEFSSEEAIARFMKRNPGDERMRELERAAAAGDREARFRLAVTRNRALLCGSCEAPLPTDWPCPLVGVDRPQGATKVCYLCEILSLLGERRNPAGDARLRELERAAAAGDQDAKHALGHALTRAGKCADCGIVLPTKPPPGSSVIPVAGSESGLKRCIACAAELDLVLVRARRPVAGYLFEIHNRENWPRTAGSTYAVGNFMGFPLLAVTELAGSRFGYTGRGLAYTAVDADRESWYGRSREVGYVTTARPKKFTERWLIRGAPALRAAQEEWTRLAREDPTGASLKARAQE